MNKVVVIAGPTCTGKSALAIKLHLFLKNHGFESAIVNFDSLLFYKELSIGTAKPTEDELLLAPHHLVAIASIAKPLDASAYTKMALPIIKKLHKNNIVPILTGGSGFYLRAVLMGMYESKTSSSDVLKKSEGLYESEGILPFWNLLKTVDPVSFSTLHANDHYRIRRAVEHWWENGTPLSEAAQDLKKSRTGLDNIHEWSLFQSYFDISKPLHADFIRERTRKMIESGLIEEVRSLLDNGFAGTERPLQSIGYKETLEKLRGSFKDENEYAERIFISTRQLAKSQRTWFKKQAGFRPYNPLNDQEMFLSDVLIFLKK
jgi:tRNA dimethylallyltransferase